MRLGWKWEEQSPTSADYGNANQFTVGGQILSLARETAQNSNDARCAGEPGELHFTFISLTGDERQSFADAVDWPELTRHLAAMASNSQVVTAGIRDGLAHLAQSDELLLLRIEDRGCVGLTGPELLDVPEPEYGNFIKLCRTNLFSGKEQAAGGSFGLGKAVYWRFSRIQTVVFNSTLAQSWSGLSRNRLFGVNQGAVHRMNQTLYSSLGHFGITDPKGRVVSDFTDDPVAETLRVARHTASPGTTALIIGFWDPDNPEHGVDDHVAELEAALQEYFWPLITRGGMRFFIDVQGDDRYPLEVTPRSQFPELVDALRAYDRGEEVAELAGPGDVVIRDIKIDIPKRKSDPTHPAFEHRAKLLVTRSDDARDQLENRVCLFRGPGMVVETIDEEFPGITYHAALLVGRALDPASDDVDLVRADDFLRIAEPPSHDRWIPPRSGSLRTSLSSNYVPPYVTNLQKIRERVKAELRDLFGVVQATDNRPPEALMKYLKVIDGGPPKRAGRPNVEITAAQVVDGRWHLEMRMTAKNRPEGWRFRPVPVFVGLEGGSGVLWAELAPVSECALDGEHLIVSGRLTGRTLRATFRGVTDSMTHPIPAERAAIDVTAAEPGPSDLAVSH